MTLNHWRLMAFSGWGLAFVMTILWMMEKQ
jgi:hypothetical protein